MPASRTSTVPAVTGPKVDETRTFTTGRSRSQRTGLTVAAVVVGTAPIGRSTPTTSGSWSEARYGPAS